MSATGRPGSRARVRSRVSRSDAARGRSPRDAAWRVRRKTRLWALCAARRLESSIGTCQLRPRAAARARAGRPRVVTVPSECAPRRAPKVMLEMMGAIDDVSSSMAPYYGVQNPRNSLHAYDGRLTWCCFLPCIADGEPIEPGQPTQVKQSFDPYPVALSMAVPPARVM